jgi:F420-dependent oxidoreductase-like protein
MLLRIFTEPQQGAAYDSLLTVAQLSESLGFDAFFRSDHYLSMGSASGLPGPSDAWTTLAGIARETRTIRLGTLVTSATFRLPGPLAITVANVDAMSGGRVELGLGAGWYEAEHTAYGIPFPPLGERFERLEEQLALITGLWATPDGDRFTLEGTHYPVVDSPALPKPVQQPGPSNPTQRPGPPIIVGGHGARRTPRLAATYAAEFNLVFSPLEETATQFGRVRAACEAQGRDPDTLAYSAGQVICCGVNDAEVAARAKAIGREVDELRTNGLCGSPEEVVAKLATYAGVGAERMYLQILDLSDLDHLALIAEQVLPHSASL